MSQWAQVSAWCEKTHQRRPCGCWKVVCLEPSRRFNQSIHPSSVFTNRFCLHPNGPTIKGRRQRCTHGKSTSESFCEILSGVNGSARPNRRMQTLLVLRFHSHCSQTNAGPLNATRSPAHPPPQTSQERPARDCSLINLDPPLEIATQTPSLVRHTPFSLASVAAKTETRRKPWFS